MQFLCNSRLQPGVSRDQVLSFLRETDTSSSWELIRKGVISSWHWKVGDQPGIAFFMTADSLDEARQLVSTFPGVKAGLVELEIDPMSPFRQFA
jgi:hypothetical protein